MEDNIDNNEHKYEYIACEIHVNYTDKLSNPSYSHELPEELANLGMTIDVWYEFINEANEEVKYRWYPKIILWSFLCCIPMLCCNQHNKDISYRMEQFCEKWNKSGRLPNGVSIRYDIQIKKFYIGANDTVRVTNLDTWHNIIFMTTPNK
jgi:hypothetical protein